MVSRYLRSVNLRSVTLAALLDLLPQPIDLLALALHLLRAVEKLGDAVAAAEREACGREVVRRVGLGDRRGAAPAATADSRTGRAASALPAWRSSKPRSLSAAPLSPDGGGGGWASPSLVAVTVRSTVSPSTVSVTTTVFSSPCTVWVSTTVEPLDPSPIPVRTQASAAPAPEQPEDAEQHSGTTRPRGVADVNGGELGVAGGATTVAVVPASRASASRAGRPRARRSSRTARRDASRGPARRRRRAPVEGSSDLARRGRCLGRVRVASTVGLSRSKGRRR